MSLEIKGRTVGGNVVQGMVNVGINGGLGPDGSAYDLRSAQTFYCTGCSAGGGSMTLYYSNTAIGIYGSSVKGAGYCFGRRVGNTFVLVYGGTGSQINTATITIDPAYKVYFGGTQLNFLYVGL
jgi:hypothetical protein